MAKYIASSSNSSSINLSAGNGASLLVKTGDTVKVQSSKVITINLSGNSGLSNNAKQALNGNP